jgi:hypothetical protein
MNPKIRECQEKKEKNERKPTLHTQYFHFRRVLQITHSPWLCGTDVIQYLCIVLELYCRTGWVHHSTIQWKKCTPCINSHKNFLVFPPLRRWKVLTGASDCCGTNGGMSLAVSEGPTCSNPALLSPSWYSSCLAKECRIWLKKLCAKFSFHNIVSDGHDKYQEAIHMWHTEIREQELTPSTEMEFSHHYWNVGM